MRSTTPLKLLPAYAGVTTMSETLSNPRARRLLWLEILINEKLDLKPWRDHPHVEEAYWKACGWYTTYNTLITSLISRQPLPFNPRPIDFREYRLFAEALRFAAAHT